MVFEDTLGETMKKYRNRTSVFVGLREREIMYKRFQWERERERRERERSHDVQEIPMRERDRDHVQKIPIQLLWIVNV